VKISVATMCFPCPTVSQDFWFFFVHSNAAINPN
jgi:hypothetical protein